MGLPVFFSERIILHMYIRYWARVRKWQYKHTPQKSTVNRLNSKCKVVCIDQITITIFCFSLVTYDTYLRGNVWPLMCFCVRVHLQVHVHIRASKLVIMPIHDIVHGAVIRRLTVT